MLLPLTRTEKAAIGVALGAILGGLVGAVWGKTSPLLNRPEDQTSPGFNDANFATAIEAGASIGAFTGGAIALA